MSTENTETSTASDDNLSTSFVTLPTERNDLNSENEDNTVEGVQVQNQEVEANNKEQEQEIHKIDDDQLQQEEQVNNKEEVPVRQEEVEANNQEQQEQQEQFNKQQEEVQPIVDNETQRNLPKKKKSVKTVRISTSEDILNVSDSSELNISGGSGSDGTTPTSSEEDIHKKRNLEETGEEEARKESEEEDPKKRHKTPEERRKFLHTRSPSLTALGFLKQEYFKMGPLVYVDDTGVFGQSKKSLFFKLTATTFEGFPSAFETHSPIKGLQRSLESIQTVHVFPNKENSHGEFVFILEFDDKVKWTFVTSSKSDLAMWVLAVDGLLSSLKGNSFATYVNPITEKHKLLQLVYVENYKGGVIKSSYEEEWTYEPSGLLTCQLLTDANKTPLAHQDFIQYQWDGEYFSPTEKSVSYGVGQWSGVFIVWYLKEWMIFKTGQREKVFKYFFDPKEREFRPESSKFTGWKWTRHFLASKQGEGEWQVEGEVPEPVIMFLQMIRYSRLGYRRVTENEEIIGTVAEKTTKPFEFLPPTSPAPTVRKETWSQSNVGIGVGLGAALGVLTLGICGYFLYRRNKS